MKVKEAIKKLKAVGFEILRQGKGDHIILQKQTERIVLSGGQVEMSLGMAGKVRSILNGEKK